VRRAANFSSSLSGVVARSRFPSFEKILFRATRGNLFMKYDEIKTPVKDPQTGKLTEKNVFVIFFQVSRPILFKFSKFRTAAFLTLLFQMLIPSGRTIGVKNQEDL
jgi:V-type H+-transporting ATPase subunit a